jgi:hypothetical protein
MDLSISDIQKELNKYEIEYKNHIDIIAKEQNDIPDFQSKLDKIYNLSSYNIFKNCGKYLDELNSNLQEDFFTSGKLIPLPEREKEAKINYNKFYLCSFYINNSLKNYQLIEKSIINLNKNQMKLCKDDCVNKSEMKLDKAKNCMKDCIDYSFNFSRKSTYEIIDSILDNLQKEIEKI